MKKKLLVFPCGSEVALEIHRSLRYSTHFDLVGASSVDDHGRFVFENYIGDIPFHTDPAFIPTLRAIVEKEKIDGIFPAMDAVARTLKENEDDLGSVVIGSDFETTALCSSKLATYECLKDEVLCPQWSSNLEEVQQYPTFIKPDEGYGSRNVFNASSKKSAQKFIDENPNTQFVFCEYLRGKEYTIDCFSNSQGQLLFCGARERVRISNGISVNTIETDKHLYEFQAVAKKINSTLRPRGAWFFQMKESSNGKPTLLEVAARIGGSSSYFRAKGVNFALLSAYDAFGLPVEIDVNNYQVELDRALGSRFKLDFDYENAYIDFDDCLLLGGRVNTELIGFIFQARNKGVRVILITRHAGDLVKVLRKYRLSDIFDEIIHIEDKRPKSEFIDCRKSIFIDDSFSERAEVKRVHGIPVFSPDMIETLVN